MDRTTIRMIGVRHPETERAFWASVRAAVEPQPTTPLIAILRAPFRWLVRRDRARAAEGNNVRAFRRATSETASSLGDPL